MEDEESESELKSALSLLQRKLGYGVLCCYLVNSCQMQNPWGGLAHALARLSHVDEADLDYLAQQRIGYGADVPLYVLQRVCPQLRWPCQEFELDLWSAARLLVSLPCLWPDVENHLFRRAYHDGGRKRQRSRFRWIACNRQGGRNNCKGLSENRWGDSREDVETGTTASRLPV